MNIYEFMAGAPRATRERASAIKDAINNNNFYVTIIEKNNKKHFKVYYKDIATGAIKSTQAKVTKDMQDFILSKNNVTFSDIAKKYLNIQ